MGLFQDEKPRHQRVLCLKHAFMWFRLFEKKKNKEKKKEKDSYFQGKRGFIMIFLIF